MGNPAFVVLGAALAALIAGFFSYLNLVSSKENKVSEFRLAWIDGLRQEISDYTAGIQDLARLERARADFTDDDLSQDAWEVRIQRYFAETRESYLAVVSSLTKIQLRMNPRHVADRPDGPEAKLMRALEEAKAAFNAGRYDDAIKASGSIRSAAAPLLKSTWDDVKNGEPSYRAVRESAEHLLTVGLGLVGASGIVIAVMAAINSR